MVVIIYLVRCRNTFCPTFTQTTYTAQVPENQAYGSAFLTLRVIDRDTVAPYNLLTYRVCHTVCLDVTIDHRYSFIYCVTCQL